MSISAVVPSKCLCRSLHSGPEGGTTPRHQLRATDQPVSHRSAQSAAFLWRHVRQWKPKQLLIPQGNTTPPPPLLSSLRHVVPAVQASPRVANCINFFSLFLLFSFHSIISSGQREEVCPPYDRHTLFTPPSPKTNTSLPTPRSKVCCVSFHLSFSLPFLSVPPFSILASHTELCAILLSLGGSWKVWGKEVALVSGWICDVMVLDWEYV